MDKSTSLLLKIMTSVLYEDELPALNRVDWKALYNESIMQTVLLQVYSKIMPFLPASEASLWEKSAMRIYAQNLENAREHGRMHRLLTRHGIPYIAIKGLASAKYYSEPLYRMLGDVDLIIDPTRMQEAYKLACKQGYKMHGAKAVDFSKDMEFHTRKGTHHIVLELHPEVGAIPSGKAGEAVNSYLSDLITSGQKCRLGKDTCRIPDDKHHCLILLIHMAGHLTKEGIGLRHLCDWAAFLNHISDQKFCEDYQIMLQECGLFRFAQILTLICEKYLGMPKRSWSGVADAALLDDLMDDILRSGNFGLKEPSRYQQIKYLRSSEDNTIETKNPLQHVLHSIHVKAKKRHPRLMKCFLTYPMGWGVIVTNYVFLLATGMRSRNNPVSIIKAADNRRKIYSELNLYKESNPT